MFLKPRAWLLASGKFTPRCRVRVAREGLANQGSLLQEELRSQLSGHDAETGAGFRVSCVEVLIESFFGGFWGFLYVGFRVWGV